MKTGKDYLEKFEISTELAGQSGLQSLLDILEVYFLNDKTGHSDFSSALEARIEELGHFSNGDILRDSVIGIFPKEETNMLWYGERMVAAIRKGILRQVVGYDNSKRGGKYTGYGPNIRFDMTNNILKRVLHGLKGFAKEQIILLYLKPKQEI